MTQTAALRFPKQQPAFAHWRGRMLLLVLTYVLVSYPVSEALRLTHATFPLGLGSGVALAAVLCWGRSMLPGVFIAHLIFVFLVSLKTGMPSPLGPSLLALSLALQTWAGDCLMRRFAKWPAELNFPGDVLRFMLLCGFVIGALGACLGIAAFGLGYDFATPAQLPGVWVDLWLSKTAGLLIATPVFLALWANPREVWAPRVISVALPLLLATLLLTLAIACLSRWDDERQFADFRREAEIASVAAEKALLPPLSDLQGRALDANPQFCRMLRCPIDGLALCHAPYQATDAKIARDLIASGAPSDRQYRVYLRADGATVHTLLLASLLRDAEGQPEALLSVVQDMTDQLQAEAHLRAREAAEMSNRSKNEFLSHMSHELRTPLNGLLGFTQLLQLDSEHRLNAEQQAWVSRIGEAGWHLLAMINDVLDLSRIETGNLKVSLERQDIHCLIDDVKTLLAGAAQHRGITVRTRLSSLARYAIGDTTRLREILSNLLSNAIKYNTQGGHVLISAYLVDAGHIEISVTDTGPGLSSLQLASLFQPFNRLGQERGQIEGTGIGLVISRRLAELMNGSLRVGSELGKGTTFTLSLPALEGEADARPAPTPAFVTAQWRRPRRLAYIEDNAVNIEVMRAVIAQRPLASLAVYEDGASGLAAMLANPPDLLLLDMQLPDTDGLSLLRRLRDAPQCARVITIMVSADALEDQIRRCMEAGASQYLTKPFNIRELLSLLDEVLADDKPA